MPDWQSHQGPVFLLECLDLEATLHFSLFSVVIQLQHFYYNQQFWHPAQKKVQGVSENQKYYKE